MVQESKLKVVNGRVVSEICGFRRTGWIFLPSRGAAGKVILFLDKDTITCLIGLTVFVCLSLPL